MKLRRISLSLFRNRARQRGMNPMSITMETAAVLSWFVVMILGEKLVGDATAARRSVTNATQQSARVNSASYCQGGSNASASSGGFTATPNMSMGSNGTPDIGSFMSIIASMGFGGQQTMQLFSMPFQQTTATANVDNVKAATLLGGNSFSFSSTASGACREKPLDKPGTSITDYRNSVFLTNIQGWAQSQ